MVLFHTLAGVWWLQGGFVPLLSSLLNYHHATCLPFFRSNNSPLLRTPDQNEIFLTLSAVSDPNYESQLCQAGKKNT